MRESLIPRWYAALAVLLPLLVAVPTGVIALVSEGSERLYASLLCVFGALAAVAAIRALAVPRRPRMLELDSSGSLVVTSPGLIVWPLVGAWFTALGAAVMTGWFVLADSSMIETPVLAVVFVLGAVASLPDLLRLVTGRLHRWRVTLTPDALTYRGYRTDLTVAWEDLHGAKINQRPAGVLVDLKGQRPDLVIPYPAFDVPAQQFVDLVIAYRRQHAHRDCTRNK